MWRWKNCGTGFDLELFKSPHPYTQALAAALGDVSQRRRSFGAIPAASGLERLPRMRQPRCKFEMGTHCSGSAIP
jgi:hypothetical protein